MDGRMNTEDIINAFMFLGEYDNIALQCTSVKDFPYLRHDVIRLMGQPDRIRGSVLFYNRKGVHLLPVDVSHDTVCKEATFYVGYSDGYDEEVLECDLGIEDIGAFSYILDMCNQINVDFIDVSRELKELGYHPLTCISRAEQQEYHS